MRPPPPRRPSDRLRSPGGPRSATGLTSTLAATLAATVAATFASLGPAAAAPLLNGRVAAQYLLLDEKTVAGLEGAVGYKRFKFGFEVAPAYTHDPRSQADLDGDSFFGVAWAIHLGGRVVDGARVFVDISTGVDVWTVMARSENESKLALPLKALAGVRVAGPLAVMASMRAYMVSSEGLHLGQQFGGTDSSPLLFTLAIGADWR